MWTKPIYCENEFLNIYFLGRPRMLIEDCQGFGKIGEAADNRIFAILYLISSIIIYNTSGKISEKSIFGLRMMNNLSQIFQAADDQEQSEFTLSYYAPKLIWTLRDFDTEDLSKNGKKLSANEYLEEILTEAKPGSSPETLKIRQQIVNNLKRRECFVFPKYNGATNFIDLPDDFIKSILFLRERVYSKSYVKQIDGISMNSRIMTSYIEYLIEAINEGTQFNLNDVFAEVFNKECSLSFAEAISYYHEYLKKKLDDQNEPYSEGDIRLLMKEIREETFNLYAEISSVKERYSQIYEEYFQKLQTYLDSKEMMIKKINNGLAKSYNP